MMRAVFREDESDSAKTTTTTTTGGRGLRWSLLRSKDSIAGETEGYYTVCRN